MSKKKASTKKVIKTKTEKVEIQPTKRDTAKKFNGYVVIDGLSYKMSEGKAKELVKKGIAKYK